MNILCARDQFGPDFTLGKMYVDGSKIGETCEDYDRHMESGGVKVDGETAIPRGRYKVAISFSTRFQKDMPALLDVPGFSGIRIHGGNTAADTHGCILLGSLRTTNGVRACAGPNELLMAFLEHAEDRGEDVWIEVK